MHDICRVFSPRNLDEKKNPKKLQESPLRLPIRPKSLISHRFTSSTWSWDFLTIFTWPKIHSYKINFWDGTQVLSESFSRYFALKRNYKPSKSPFCHWSQYNKIRLIHVYIVAYFQRYLSHQKILSDNTCILALETASQIVKDLSLFLWKIPSSKYWKICKEIWAI